MQCKIHIYICVWALVLYRAAVVAYACAGEETEERT